MFDLLTLGKLRRFMMKYVLPRQANSTRTTTYPDFEIPSLPYFAEKVRSFCWGSVYMWVASSGIRLRSSCLQRHNTLLRKVFSCSIARCGFLLITLVVQEREGAFSQFGQQDALLTHSSHSCWGLTTKLEHESSQRGCVGVADQFGNSCQWQICLAQ